MQRIVQNRIASIVVAVLVSFMLIGGVAYAKNGGNDDLRIASVKHRIDNMKKAVALYPDPILSNFPLRGALVKFAIRQDEVNHPYYVYLLNMMGEPIGYYVAQTYPQSTCNFLGSTEQILPDYEGAPIVTAPSYDGVFYGGAGAGSACTAMFFFDANDTLHVFNNQFWQASDQPITLWKDVQPFDDNAK